MKPKRIILIRHGESLGNTDWGFYGKLQNHKIPLTPKGRLQAFEAGKELKIIIKNQSVQFYVSPYLRTRETYAEILKSFGKNTINEYEEPRLREQDSGHLRPESEYKENKRKWTEFGTFFYRFPDGESGADVFDRVSTFLETLHRDFRKTDFPDNVIIVTHGLALRLFIMRWFHLPYEKYEQMSPPENCNYVVMEKADNKKYQITGGTYKLIYPA